jgi:hypothetical protein
VSSASVDIHCYRRRDAAGGGTVGLQTLEFMGDLVEAPLYGGLPMDREREWQAISWSRRTLLTHIDTLFLSVVNKPLISRISSAKCLGGMTSTS